MIRLSVSYIIVIKLNKASKFLFTLYYACISFGSIFIFFYLTFSLLRPDISVQWSAGFTESKPLH